MRLKHKNEQKTVLEKHGDSVDLETRFRNMKEVIRYKKMDETHSTIQ